MLVAFDSLALNGFLNGLIEVAHSVSICNGQLLESDVTLLIKVNVVPDLGDILTRQRNLDAFDRPHEVFLVDHALASLVQETEHFCDATMPFFHTSQDQTSQVLHVLQLGLGLRGHKFLLHSLLVLRARSLSTHSCLLAPKVACITYLTLKC